MLHKTPQEILDGHTSYELQEWQAWLKVEEEEHRKAEQMAKSKSAVRRR